MGTQSLIHSDGTFWQKLSLAKWLIFWPHITNSQPQLNTPLSKKKKERKLSSHGTVFFGKQGIGEGHGLMAMRDLSVILTFNNPWLSIFCCLFILTSGWTHFRGSLCARKFTEHSAWKRRTCHLESISPQGRLQQSTHHTHTHTTRIH